MTNPDPALLLGSQKDLLLSRNDHPLGQAARS
jgi:hypothetical protein